MADDWQVGDLAVEDDGAPPCALCANDDDEGDDFTHSGVVEVVAVSAPEYPEVVCGLRFAGDPLGELPWCSCGFRKILPDKHEPCEEEFVTLLKRKRVRA